ncbi:hypothetical protein BU17DRAFT_78822 [Hysterangium stoloniferum]|nr:hypothetical protein BU17DRAFT_78822 [Hysterangium stoloniferum]
MDNPTQEFIGAVTAIAAASNAVEQADAFNKIFVNNATFNHPLVKVTSGLNSRQRILALYQGYRILSPRVEITIQSFVESKAEQKIFLDIVQKLYLFGFIPGAPAKLVAEFTLVSKNKKWFVKDQVDYYQPEELAKLTNPLLAKLLDIQKFILTLLIVFLVRFLKIWKPKSSDTGSADHTSTPIDDPSPSPGPTGPSAPTVPT